MSITTDRQFSLGGLTFGEPTGYTVTAVEFGPPEIRQVDTDNPREDGIRMGRDHRGGRIVTLEVSALGDDATVRDQVALLERAWLASDTRSSPGAVTPLSYRVAGEDRRVYGRPRRFAADPKLLEWGRVDVVAEFQAIDHLYYSDVEFQTTLGIVPPSAGGLVGPLIGPWIASGTGEGSQSIAVDGTEAAWLICRVDGPITNPTVEATDLWSVTLKVTLASDQWVVIDPTPWSRSVRRNDGANLSGAFTALSSRLPQMRVPPGVQQVFLRGVDPSGTSSLSVYWRSTFASF